MGDTSDSMVCHKKIKSEILEIDYYEQELNVTYTNKYTDHRQLLYCEKFPTFICQCKYAPC